MKWGKIELQNLNVTKMGNKEVPVPGITRLRGDHCCVTFRDLKMKTLMHPDARINPEKKFVLLFKGN